MLTTAHELPNLTSHPNSCIVGLHVLIAKALLQLNVYMHEQEQQLQLSPAKVAILMLTTAHELYKKSSQPASRLMYHIGALMAREHLASEDANSAQKLLESVAGEHSNAALGSLNAVNGRLPGGAKVKPKHCLSPITCLGCGTRMRVLMAPLVGTNSSQ